MDNERRIGGETATEFFKRAQYSAPCIVREGKIYAGFDYGVGQDPASIARSVENYESGYRDGGGWGVFRGIVWTLVVEAVIAGLVVLIVKAV